MAESTTITGMDAPTPEPTTMATALAPWMERLKERGLAVTPPAEDTTVTPVPKEDPEDARARRQARLDNYAKRWQDQLPVMYRDASVDDLDDTQHHATVRFWLESGSLHLVLAGSVGTGKTYAAYAVGNQALAKGRWVEAWVVGDLLAALRPGSSDLGALGRARSCQVLILDDLPAKASDWEAEQLTLILDARLREGLQTVVTTNITSAQITETWGGRFMDRLRYRLTALTFSGPSRRESAW